MFIQLNKIKNNKIKNITKYLLSISFFLISFLIFLINSVLVNASDKSLNDLNKTLNDPKTKEFIDEEFFLKSEINFVNEIESLNKYSQSVLKSSASIIIIQPQELKYFFYPNIKRLLNFSPGIYIVEDGAYWYLGSKGIQIPGSYNSRALFLLNGLTLNEPLFGTPISIPTYLVNNIEIVFGFSNVYFGSNSLLATINIIPNYKNLDNQFYLSTFINFNDNKINTLNNFIFNKNLTKDNYLKLSIGASLLNYKGSKIFFKERQELSLDPIAYYIDNSYENYFYISLFTEDSEFYFNISQNKYHFPTGVYNTVFNTFETNSIDSYYNILYRKKIKIDTNKIISINFYNQKFKEFGNYLYDNLINYLNIDNLKSNIFSLDTNINITKEKYNFLLGTEVRNLSFKLNNFDVNYDIDKNNRYLLNEYLNIKRSSIFLFSIYTNIDYCLKDDLILSSSLRYDNYSNLYNNFKSILVPKIGLIKLLENDSAIKLIYSSNYRAPSISETYYNDGGISTLDNLNLLPEKHNTLELIYYKEFNTLNQKGYLNISLYNMKISNLINNVIINNINNISQFQNIGNIYSTGALLDYFKQNNNKNLIRFSISYSNARIKSNLFEFLPNSPKLLILFKYGFNLNDNLLIGFETKYTSNVISENNIKIKDYLLSNLTISYYLSKNNYFTINIENLFNTKYYNAISYPNNYPIYSFPSKKRNIYLGINYSF
ncbi:MAG: TonB-dependent receptor plug domain-containing protein [bacterium]